MTAYSEKDDPEAMLRRMAPPVIEESPRQTAPDAAVKSLWDVVAADDSTSDLEAPSEKDRCTARELEAGRDVASPGRNIGMPIAVPKLPKTLYAATNPKTAVRKLRAGTVVSSGRHAGYSRTPPSAASLAMPSRHPAPAVIPPQVPGRCREIDSRLARIIGAWGELPQSIRQALVAMIESFKQDP